LIWPNATSGTACPVELTYATIHEAAIEPPAGDRSLRAGRSQVQVAMSTFNATGKGSVSFFGSTRVARWSAWDHHGDEPQFGRR